MTEQEMEAYAVEQYEAQAKTSDLLSFQLCDYGNGATLQAGSHIIQAFLLRTPEGRGLTFHDQAAENEHVKRVLRDAVAGLCMAMRKQGSAQEADGKPALILHRTEKGTARILRNQ